jgi:N-acetylmuramoyl-L-alanine amidase
MSSKFFKTTFFIVSMLLIMVSCKPSDHNFDNLINYDHYDWQPEEFNYTFDVGGNTTLYLNFHCTASKENKNLRGPWFLRFFAEELGWSKPGYNEIVELDGNRFISVPYDLDGYTTWDEVSYGVKGKNSFSINVAYVGGVDANLVPKDTRTEAQKRSMDQIAYEVSCALNDIMIKGHRDHEGVKKACPSFQVSSEYGHLGSQVDRSDLFDYAEEYK